MEKIKNILKKIKHNKLVIFILIIGMVLLFIPTGNEGKKEENAISCYEKELSLSLSEALGKIDGAGKVKVMVTFYDKGSFVPFYDKNENGENQSEKPVSVSGKVAVMKEEYPKVRGVLVIAQGGEDKVVREKLTNAVLALTGAPFHNIKVYKMEG